MGVALAVTLLAGELILDFFGISVASFQVGGGILILMNALSMLQGKVGPTRQTAEEAQETQEKEQVAVVPLGVPLIAGPGAISTGRVLAGLMRRINKGFKVRSVEDAASLRAFGQALAEETAQSVSARRAPWARGGRQDRCKVAGGSPVAARRVAQNRPSRASPGLRFSTCLAGLTP